MAQRKYDEHDRPGVLEFHYYYLPVAIMIAGGYVEASDAVLGTHFTDEMANVQVMPHSNKFEQTIEKIVQDIGKAGGGHVHHHE